MPQIDFYYDPASPYTYLAATQLPAIAARHDAQVRYRPMLIGKVFEATGNRMPASVPAKAQYMMGDLKRWAAYFDEPFTFPKHFPINSMLPQRVACAVDDEQAADWALAVMRAYWVDGHDIGQPDGVRAAAAALGWDADALLQKAQDQAVKDRLRAITDEAVTRGVFGAPTFFLGDAMFWGCDRLPLLEHHLARPQAA